MDQNDYSRLKVQTIVLVGIALVVLYGLDRLFLFQKSPYLGIYGELRSKGFYIQTVIDVKSSEPITNETYITSLDGIPIDEWLRSFLRISPKEPLWSTQKPVELTILNKEDLSKRIFVYPRQASIKDLFQKPFWPWFLASFILFCGTYLLFHYPKQTRVRILSILLLTTSMSIYNYAGKHLLLEIGPRLPVILTVRLGTFCVIFSSWLYLILILLQKRDHLKLPKWTPWVLYTLPPIVALISMLAAWESPLAGIEISYRILYLIGGIIVIFSFTILIHAYSTTKDPLLKGQIKWLLWGQTLGMSPYVFLYTLPKALTGIPLISYGLSLVFIPLIIFSLFFAFYRYRLMDVDQVIHGSIVYGISVVLLAFPYLLILGMLHQKIVVSSVEESWFRLDLLILLGVALVFNPLKNLVQRGIDRALFPERLGLSILLMDGSTKLTRASNLDEITGFLIKDLPERISIERTALFLRQQFGQGWELRENPEGWMDLKTEMILTLDILSKKSLPPFWDTLHDDETPSDSGPLSFLGARAATVIFPMNSGDDLWGFYILGNKTMNRLLSEEEIRVISTLCTQAAHTLGNARLMEGLQKTNRSLADLSLRLMQAERMADLGEGAAILAHEIKNPLGIVRGSAEILLKAKDPSEKEKLASFILEETERLSKTVDDFLQFARMSPPSKSDTDLNNLVQSAAFLWETRRKSSIPVSVRFQRDQSGGKVLLDSRQIYQALLNIFTNAEEAMPQGGEIFISTGVDSEGKQAWVSIKDTGKGIHQEHLEKVFDRFFTTKDSGLGLGLSVVNKVMESHGGSVRIESSPENGTKVALYFPL